MLTGRRESYDTIHGLDMGADSYIVKSFDPNELIPEGAKKRNKAAVMVTHDERMLKYCDRVYEISDGVLKEMEQTV
ncbi:response regulator [Salinicoccus roseus]